MSITPLEAGVHQPLKGNHTPKYKANFKGACVSLVVIIICLTHTHTHTHAHTHTHTHTQTWLQQAKERPVAATSGTQRMCLTIEYKHILAARNPYLSGPVGVKERRGGGGGGGGGG